MSILSNPRFPFYVMLMVTLVLVLYHFIALCFCTGRRLTRIGRANASDVPGGCMIANTPTARMISENIPAHKYRKAEMSGNLVGEEGMCAVCLGDFEEGEDLRTLPGCLHSFHVSCIDKWLLSHANCPICRADQFPN